MGWTDGKSLLAVTDPDEFVRQRRESEHIGVDAGAAEGARAEPGELLAHWRAGRDRLLVALTATRSTVAWSGTGRR
ncbi:maleylpyruvate isomerase N-terminal domain-containing protein [Saccharopolyspora sp. NPDC000995]